MKNKTGLQVELPNLCQQLTLENPQNFGPEQAEGFLFACGSAMAIAVAAARRISAATLCRTRDVGGYCRKAATGQYFFGRFFCDVGLYFQTRAMRMRGYVSSSMINW